MDSTHTFQLGKEGKGVAGTTRIYQIKPEDYSRIPMNETGV